MINSSLNISNSGAMTFSDNSQFLKFRSLPFRTIGSFLTFFLIIISIPFPFSFPIFLTIPQISVSSFLYQTTPYFLIFFSALNFYLNNSYQFFLLILIYVIFVLRFLKFRRVFHFVIWTESFFFYFIVPPFTYLD